MNYDMSMKYNYSHDYYRASSLQDPFTDEQAWAESREPGFINKVWLTIKLRREIYKGVGTLKPMKK